MIDETLKKKVLDGLQSGVAFGWWEDVDLERLEPIPFPIIVDRDKCKDRFMSQILARQGIFPSVSAAKKAGWDKPVSAGEYWFKNRTVRLQVI